MLSNACASTKPATSREYVALSPANTAQSFASGWAIVRSLILSVYEPLPQLWLTESIPSVTENTTVNLGATEKKVVPTTDRLK